MLRTPENLDKKNNFLFLMEIFLYSNILSSSNYSSFRIILNRCSLCKENFDYDLRTVFLTGHCPGTDRSPEGSY